ncbi:hypothetical protein JCM11251_005713 [Rhodosporidiobolus azoricus]
MRLSLVEADWQHRLEIARTAHFEGPYPQNAQGGESGEVGMYNGRDWVDGEDSVEIEGVEGARDGADEKKKEQVGKDSSSSSQEQGPVYSSSYDPYYALSFHPCAQPYPPSTYPLVDQGGTTYFCPPVFLGAPPFPPMHAAYPTLPPFLPYGPGQHGPANHPCAFFSSPLVPTPPLYEAPYPPFRAHPMNSPYEHSVVYPTANYPFPPLPLPFPPPFSPPLLPLLTGDSGTDAVPLELATCLAPSPSGNSDSTSFPLLSTRSPPSSAPSPPVPIVPSLPPRRRGKMFTTDRSSASFLKRLSKDGHARSTGQVKWFDPERGFGFIRDEHSVALGGRDVFIHYTRICQAVGFRCLAAGEIVEYTLVAQETGRVSALGVTRLSHSPATGLRDPLVKCHDSATSGTADEEKEKPQLREGGWRSRGATTSAFISAHGDKENESPQSADGEEGRHATQDWPHLRPPQALAYDIQPLLPLARSSAALRRRSILPLPRARPVTVRAGF